MNGPLVFMLHYILGRTDSFYRTNISTGTTINTLIGIDFIDIAFRNSFRWAFRKTGTTRSAIITNQIRHNIKFYSYSDKFKFLSQMKK